jgi:hypothetical protein
MLKNARLYKDENGYIWHVKSDGTAMQYPTFTHHDKPAKGAYEEVSLLNHSSTRVSDSLYLAMLDNGKTTLVAAEAAYKTACFDIFTGDCFVGNFSLFPVANLVCGHEYVVNGDVMTLDYYDDESKTFVFLPNSTELGACVKIAQICGVKEVSKMPKMYEIWKDENGQAHGRDCKTGRVFAIGASAFDNVDMCAHNVRVGDTVYIKNKNNLCPSAFTIISKAAKELNDNAVMLRFAYGYTPSNLVLQGDWSVIWADAVYAVIERENKDYLPLVLCTTKNNLAVKDAEGDSKHN